MSKPRPQMRRAKSHYSIRTKFTAEEESESDDSISDISMDTCFRFERDEEDVTDESDEEQALQKKRSFRNSDPSFHENMMVVTPSFRRKPGLSKMMSSKRGGALNALTMEDIDVNDRSDFLRFDSSEFMAATSRSKQLRRKPSLEDSGDEATPVTPGKAREFEDINDKKLSTSQRHLEFEGISQDPFLSGDDEVAPSNKKRRKKKKKQTKKEKDGGEGGIDWDEVDAKGKASLAAYSVAEGNIYPEISKVEAKQFKRSGNAWLEGRYSTNADWKRDASGMVLDIPTPSPNKKDKPKLNRPNGLVTDRIGERSKNVTPPRGRTELSLVGAAAIAPIPEHAEPEEKEQDLHRPLPELMEKPTSKPTSKPAKSSDNRRSLFLRANSMPSFKLGNLQRVFKRSNTPSSDAGDGEGLLEDKTEDKTAGFHESLLLDESINSRGVSSVGMSSVATPSISQTGTPESKATPSTRRKRSGSVEGTPRRRRSDSIGEASGEKTSKSKSKKSSKKESKSKSKDTSDSVRRSKHAAVMNSIITESPQTSLRRISVSKKESKSKSKDTSDSARRSKHAAIMNAIITESPQTSLRRISVGQQSKPVESAPTAKRSTKKQQDSGSMPPIGENLSHKGDIKSKELRKVVNIGPPPKAGLRRIKSLESTQSAAASAAASATMSQRDDGSSSKSLSMDESSNSEAFFVLEVPTRKLRKQSEDREDRSPNTSRSPNRIRAKSYDADILEEPEVESRARRRGSNESKTRRRGSNESQKFSYESPKEEVEDYTLTPSNDFVASLSGSAKTDTRVMRGTQSASPSRERTSSFDKDTLERTPIQSNALAHANKGSNEPLEFSYESPSEEVDDYTLTPSNDFVASLNVKLKMDSRISGSSDDSSQKAPKSKHRRRTTSVSSHDTDDASEKKSKRRSKRRGSVERSSTRSGRNRRRSHSTEGLEDEAATALEQDKYSRRRRESHSSDDMEDNFSSRSEYRATPRKSSSSDALEEILSMSSRLQASCGSFSLKSEDSSQDANLLIQQIAAREGGMDESRKSEKKQRKKDKRRSTSVPKPKVVEADLAAGESKPKEEHSERSRRERGSTHRRRRSTSIPKRAEEAEARAAGQPRRRGGSVEAKNRDRGSTHRRRRGSSVPRAAAVAAAERLAVKERATQNLTEGAPLSPNTNRPRRRWSIGEVNSPAGRGANHSNTSHEPQESTAEQVARQNRRRRSLNLGGEVVSSQGVDDAEAPIQVRERNESHQYVGFSGGSRNTDPPPESAPEKPSKTSFLSRFANNLGNEATATKQVVARRSMMQRAQSERSFKHNAQMPLGKSFTPTFKQQPGTQAHTAAPTTGGAYSDMVMQGKIGIAATTAES